MKRRPLSSTLFPYTRSSDLRRCGAAAPRSRPAPAGPTARPARAVGGDRKSTRLNSSHTVMSYAVLCLEKKSKRGAAKDDRHSTLRDEHDNHELQTYNGDDEL